MAFFRPLYVQVLAAIVLAVVLGIVAPGIAVEMKPLGDGFIALPRMLLGPIIFCSVVLGLTHVRDMSQLGRLAFKSLLYFEILTKLGMAIGFVAVNLFQPGDGLHATNLAMNDSVTKISGAASHFTAVGFFLSIIPTTLIDGRGPAHAPGARHLHEITKLANIDRRTPRAAAWRCGAVKQSNFSCACWRVKPVRQRQSCRARGAQTE